MIDNTPITANASKKKMREVNYKDKDIFSPSASVTMAET